MYGSDLLPGYKDVWSDCLRSFTDAWVWSPTQLHICMGLNYYLATQIYGSELLPSYTDALVQYPTWLHICMGLIFYWITQTYGPDLLPEHTDVWVWSPKWLQRCMGMIFYLATHNIILDWSPTLLHRCMGLISYLVTMMHGSDLLPGHTAWVVYPTWLHRWVWSPNRPQRCSCLI